MAPPLAPGRRAMLGGSAAVLLAGAAAALPKPAADPDADLVRVCHAFAEAEFRNWWRYVVAPDHLADAQDTDPDWPTLAWITETPATTPTGWAAKALALAAWDREMYDDLVPAERDTRTGLLAALLRDMVAPARAAILARCEAEYGPLGEGYDADARWIGRLLAAAAAPLPPHLDAELLAACGAFNRARAEVDRLVGLPETPDEVFEPANDAVHTTLIRVSDLRARTTAGVRAKAAVCRVVLAMDEPSAIEGRFDVPARRHDVLAWSTLADLAE